MALLKKLNSCPLSPHFSKIFSQCFHDMFDAVLMKTGALCFSSYDKLSSKTYCALSATRNKLILDDVVKLRGKKLPQCLLQSFSTEENVSDAPDAFSKFSTGIDLNTLRDARIRELRLKGKDFNIHHIVKKIVKEKCDEAFVNLNAEDQRKLKIVQLEHDVLYSQGYNILPAEEMTSENWLDAMTMSVNQRRRYFFFLQSIRQKKQRGKEEKALKRTLQAEKNFERSDGNSADDNRIFIRLYGSTIKRWQNHILASSMRFGLPLVWDMGYSEFMNSREIKNTAAQLLDVYFLNRLDQNTPFHLHFTNCPDDNPVFRYMQMYLQNDPHFMATVTPQSCMDVFDSKDLVYLSPHSPVVMNEFNPNAVYVLGAFNDKAYQRPISYARAKELGLKCMQLPLDQYVRWKMGSKSLTLNQMMMIFQAKKNKKTWHEALTAIPTRKINFSN